MSHPRHATKLKKREEGFDVKSLNAVKLPEYNALFDPNMRHFFENKKVQQHLYKSGQIDSHGRVIDMDKNKQKVHILEREFQQAELTEQRRMREELEMRYQVQKKRFNELERIRKEEILTKLKHDRDLSKEIINIMRATSTGSLAATTRGNTSSRTPGSSKFGSSNLNTPGALANAGFFITEDR